MQNVSNRAQKLKSKNEIFVIEKKSNKSRDNFLYNYKERSSNFLKKLLFAMRELKLSM